MRGRGQGSTLFSPLVLKTIKYWCKLSFSVALHHVSLLTSSWSLKLALAGVMLSVYKHPKRGDSLFFLPLFYFLMHHTRMPLIWCGHEVITLGIGYALADPTISDYHIIKRRIPHE